MQKKFNKRGFTIVELVIVIAVVAILAAVLIPTFSSIIDKANKSSDTQLVRNLNTALKADGDHDTMTDALAAASAFGYDVTKINASATDKEILWDSVNDLFCYYDTKSGEPSYIPDFKPTQGVKDYQYWMISDKVDANTQFSVYYTGTAEDIVTSKGFDAGTSTGIKTVTYANAGDAQEVVIRTNSYRTNLTVDAPNDIVHHYDIAGTVNVVSSDVASYHEYGTVPFLEVAGGHIVLENTSDVTAVHFTATAGIFKNEDDKVISIDLSKVVEDKTPTFSRDNVVIAGEGTFVAKVTGTSDEYIWLWGNGTASDMIVTTVEGAIAESGSLKDGIVAGATEGTVADQIANSDVTDANGNYVVKNSKEDVKQIIDEYIEEKIEEEDAALNGDCAHNYQPDGYLADSEPSCTEGGIGKFVCSLCEDIIYQDVEPLTHDLIGVYCNRCHHPVAFVDEITDFTVNDEAGIPRMPVIVDIINGGIGSAPAGELYLDIAYSFKAFPNNDSSVLDGDAKYSFNEETEEFYLDENGEFTAQDIFDSFSGWYCDYYVSFDSDVDAFSCGLGGYYESFNMALGFLAPAFDENGKIPGGLEIPLLGSMISSGWTYGDIVDFVGEFKCGFFNISEDNVGKTFTVKLRMTNPADETGTDFIDVAITNYVIEAPSAENMKIVEAFPAGTND